VIRKGHADVVREFEELSGLCKVKSNIAARLQARGNIKVLI
jgi:hypothetical protein